ncbi:hypothetical protein [Alkaliphilus transvaalensis]|uniref:hypothetical protein n=1 Tax=Alkaliphilus transvaalensis TaxID=114628 RepID=UPI00047BD47E|nr:hypothetical protein [Alkaliphilus transvaalensis]
MDAQDLKLKHAQNLIRNGIIYSIVIFLWPIFMGLSAVSGSIEEQIRLISQNTLIYRLNFIIASLIAPTFFYLIVVFLELYKKEYKKEKYSKREIVGCGFLTLYTFLISISYISQYTIFIRRLEGNVLENIERWYFGNVNSMAYFLNQFGYAMWAVGILLLIYSLLEEKGLKKVAAVLLLISAVASLLAFSGLLLNNSFLNSLTIFSGILITPIGIVSIIMGYKIKKSYN